MSKRASSPIARVLFPLVILIRMWILKKSKYLLKTRNSRLLSEYNSIKIDDFSILYTSSFSHNHLKSRLNNIIHRCYYRNVGTTRYMVEIPHTLWKKISSKFFQEVFKMLELFIPVWWSRFTTNGLSFQWEQIVLLYLLTYSFILMRLTS